MSAQPMRQRPPAEKAVEAWVMDAFRKAGLHVYKLSQARATQQTPGLPDLWVFCTKRGIGFWFEVKRPGGKLRPHQVAFRERCEACDVMHVVGGLDEAVGVLRRFGLVKREAA